jgi:N-acetylglucosaminyldiphosphoundecaprenol N-acetyl-beta-D-mannosaminyltransferase
MTDNFTTNNVRILGVPFTLCDFAEILATMERSISRHANGHCIAITNTESTYYAKRFPAHFGYINKAEFSCCDGIGLVLAARMSNRELPRLHGPDLMLKCCEYGLERKWRHYFYGGKEGVPELLSENLAGRFPGLIIAGTYSPPFRPLTPEEDVELIQRINGASPDIVWVGLGLLKQERWIDEHLNKIKAPWMIGVGAAFDFHAGTVRRAPKVFRNIGLEWLYRLAFEPRMFIRNVRSFLLLVQAAKEALKRNPDSGS